MALRKPFGEESILYRHVWEIFYVQTEKTQRNLDLLIKSYAVPFTPGLDRRIAVEDPQIFSRRTGERHATPPALCHAIVVGICRPKLPGLSLSGLIPPRAARAYLEIGGGAQGRSYSKANWVLTLRTSPRPQKDLAVLLTALQ